jgi:N-hydroxyarylamine O-acetyltransferase
MLDVASYLERIAYSGSTTPSIDTLRAIHHARLQTVPFENLDVALGRKIVLDEGALLRQVIDLGRGGFCYELNGAFAALLQADSRHASVGASSRSCGRRRPRLRT